MFSGRTLAPGLHLMDIPRLNDAAIEYLVKRYDLIWMNNQSAQCSFMHLFSIK